MKSTRIGPKQPARPATQDIPTGIAEAVSRGIFQPPSAETQHKIDTLAAKNKKQLVRSSAQQQTSGRALEAPANDRKIHSGSLANAAAVANGTSLRQPKHGKKATLGRKPYGKRKLGVVAEPPKKKPRMATENIRPKNMRKDQQTIKPQNSRPKLSPARISVVEMVAQPPHPSGSKTLEPHQSLPPNAYFEKANNDEDLAWRCGTNHCLGYYYNAGDRKACKGCNTNRKFNLKTQIMDFYLPPGTYSYQPAPDVVWTPPNKYNVKPRKSKQPVSHNSLAGEVFREAVLSGATTDEARQKAVEHVKEYLRPKPKREPEPEPEPEPTPEPVDLGPHPSGSTTMEHGQDIPEDHYFEKRDRHEEFAWRCDGSHALGRYYMSGERKTCVGCGRHKSQAGTTCVEMDFYLPWGTFCFQEAGDLMDWRPRRPYNVSKSKGLHNDPQRKKQIASHNQRCALRYWEAVDEEGMSHEEALDTAIKETIAYLGSKSGRAGAASKEPKPQKKSTRTKKVLESESDDEAQSVDVSSDEYVSDDGEDVEMDRNEDGGAVVSLFSRDEESDSGSSEAESASNGVEEPDMMEISDDSSDGADASSASDSERCLSTELLKCVSV
jgi:hypothetical protein